jgi:hypothetical protein
LSLAVLGGDSDFSVKGEEESPSACKALACKPFSAAGVPLPRCGTDDFGGFPDELFLALDGRGSSSLINSLRGSSRGTNMAPSLPGVTAFAAGVPCRVDDAKNSAGLLLSLVADADILGLIFPPPCGVSDLGVISAMGFGGPADGGAKILWVSPTLYSGNGVTFGASGMFPYGFIAPI